MPTTMPGDAVDHGYRAELRRWNDQREAGPTRARKLYENDEGAAGRGDHDRAAIASSALRSVGARQDLEHQNWPVGLWGGGRGGEHEAHVARSDKVVRGLRRPVVLRSRSAMSPMMMSRLGASSPLKELVHRMTSSGARQGARQCADAATLRRPGGRPLRLTRSRAAAHPLACRRYAYPTGLGDGAMVTTSVALTGKVRSRSALCGTE